MQFVKFVGGILHQSHKAARSLGQSVQEVVEVLQPGPLGSTAARWDAQRRADADHAVQQAVAKWQALQQQLHLHGQQEHEQQQEQQQLQQWEAQQQHIAVTVQYCGNNTSSSSNCSSRLALSNSTMHTDEHRAR